MRSPFLKWKHTDAHVTVNLRFPALSFLSATIYSTHSFFHFQTSWTKLSLPRSWRLRPLSLISFFSTTTWVAIPAWSQPGFHKVVSPRILCLEAAMENKSQQTGRKPQRYWTGCRTQPGTHHLVRESWMALVRAWPRWSDPVTLGGGMQIMNMPRGFWSMILFLCQGIRGRQTGYYMGGWGLWQNSWGGNSTHWQTFLPHTLAWRIPASPTTDTRQLPHTVDCRSREEGKRHLKRRWKEKENVKTVLMCGMKTKQMFRSVQFIQAQTTRTNINGTCKTSEWDLLKTKTCPGCF